MAFSARLRDFDSAVWRVGEWAELGGGVVMKEWVPDSRSGFRDDKPPVQDRDCDNQHVENGGFPTLSRASERRENCG